MTPNDFIFWLEGFLVANPNLTSLNEEQTKRLKDKLITVFNKITPNTSFPHTYIPVTIPKTYEHPDWRLPEFICNSDSFTKPFDFNPDNQPKTC